MLFILPAPNLPWWFGLRSIYQVLVLQKSLCASVRSVASPMALFQWVILISVWFDGSGQEVFNRLLLHTTAQTPAASAACIL